MVSDTDKADSDGQDQNESAATKVDQFTDSIKPDIDQISNKRVENIDRSVKVSFTIILAALFVYWIVAYQTGIQLFHF